MNCTWHDQGKKECDGPYWVVAYSCPGCNFRGTLLLCTVHYTVYAFCAKEKLLLCGQDSEIISVMSRALDSGTEEEYIHEL